MRRRRGPCAQTKRSMPTLITPAPQRTLWRLQDKKALKEWTEARNIGWRLRGNLNQLLGFDDIGTSGARTGHGRDDYHCLHDVTWMYHQEQTEVIPLFGSGPKKFEQLQAQGTAGFKLRKFQAMMATQGERSEDGWWVGAEPSAVASLPNGSSLFGIARMPGSAAVPGAQLPPVPLPDYGAQTLAFHPPAADEISPATGRPEVSLEAFRA